MAEKGEMRRGQDGVPAATVTVTEVAGSRETERIPPAIRKLSQRLKNKLKYADFDSDIGRFVIILRISYFEDNLFSLNKDVLVI